MAGMRANDVVRNTTAAVLVAVIALVSACGGSDDPPPPPPPAEGSASLGPGGGTVPGPDGSSVAVPAGALASTLTLRIARDGTGAPPLPAGMAPLGAVYTLTPHGTHFGEPVGLALPFNAAALPAGASPQFLLAEQGGPWTVLSDATVQGGLLSAPSMSFSYGTVATDGAAGPPRVVLSLIAPTNLPTVSPTSSTRLLDQATTITLRASVRAGVVHPTNNWACTNTPTLELQRALGIPNNPTNIPPPSFGFVTIATQQSGSTADFSVPLDHTHNSLVWFRIRFTCDVRVPAGTQVDAAMMPPWHYGYVWLRVNVPTPVAAPTISQQPQSLTVVEGNRAEFRMGASAPDTLAINWQRSNDGGATWATVQTNGDTYTLAPAQLADNGARFRAQVCNALGVTLNCIFSDVATLTVTPAAVSPVFTSQPQSISVVEGQTASFSAVATATPTPTVRWFREAASGPATQVGPTCTGSGSQTSCTYTTGPVTLADSGARFFAIATNGTDNTMSAIATLTVTPAAVAPSIPSGQPADVSVSVGQSATFSVSATGTAPLSYQWQRNGIAIMGANGASYTLANAQLADDGARFSVVVSNGAGSVTSREAVLTVTASPPPPSAGICTTSSAAGWCWVQPGPHSNELSALAFDGTTVHALGRRTSMRSDDGGTTWQTAFNAIDVYWWDLVAPSSGVLVAAGNGGYVDLDAGIYRSTDGGQTWTRTLTTTEVTHLAFADASSGVAVGSEIWRTTDGGLNWTPAGSVPPSARLARVVANGTSGYVAVGSGGLIMRSTNGGQTWSTAASGTGDDLYDVAFANNGSVGIAITGFGAALRTTDGGATWSAPVAVAAFGGLQTVAFADANTVVAMGARGRVYRSTDAGLTWTPGDDLDFSGAEYLARLKFRSASEGFAVGMYGQVWRTVDAGQSWSLVAGGSDLESFTSVKFRSGEGMAVGIGGVYRSLNGGASWEALAGASSGASAVDLALLDTSIRVVVGFDIRRTTDRGLTWSTVHTLASGIAVAVDFVPSTGTATTGVAVGNSAGIALMRRTTDGGLSWSPVSVGTVPALFAVAFSANNPGLGLAGGLDRTLLRTTDGGATWSPVTMSALGPTEAIQAIRFTSTGALIAADGGLYRSTDGGFNWTRVYDSSGRGGMLDVTFLSATEAVAVGVSGTIVRSTDAGATWTLVDVPVTVTLSGVAFTGIGSEIVAVGDAGTILRNTQGGSP